MNAPITTSAPVGSSLDLAAGRAGLTISASGRWPEHPGDELPGVAGFIVSAFNPIVIEVADRALRHRYGPPPPKGGTIERADQPIAVLIVSRYGDAVSAAAVAAAVDGGDRVGPLMFFQSVPNAPAGFVAARWGLTGPVAAISPVGPPLLDGLATAGSLLDDGDAAAVLLVFAEDPAAPPAIPVARQPSPPAELEAIGPAGGGLALLVTAATETPAVTTAIAEGDDQEVRTL